MSHAVPGDPQGRQAALPPPPPVAPGVSTAYENALHKLDQQRQEIDQLDTKLAATIALLGIAVAGYATGARTLAERLCGGVLLGLATVVALYGYFVRKYANAPTPRTFARYAGYPAERMQELFLEAVLEAFEANELKRETKARAVNAAFVLIGLLAVGLIIVVATQADPRVK